MSADFSSFGRRYCLPANSTSSSDSAGSLSSSAASVSVRVSAAGSASAGAGTSADESASSVLAAGASAFVRSSVVVPSLMAAPSFRVDERLGYCGCRRWSRAPVVRRRRSDRCAGRPFGRRRVALDLADHLDPVGFGAKPVELELLGLQRLVGLELRILGGELLQLL